MLAGMPASLPDNSYGNVTTPIGRWHSQDTGVTPRGRPAIILPTRCLKHIATASCGRCHFTTDYVTSLYCWIGTREPRSGAVVSPIFISLSYNNRRTFQDF